MIRVTLHLPKNKIKNDFIQHLAMIAITTEKKANILLNQCTRKYPYKKQKGYNYSKKYRQFKKACSTLL